MTTDRSSSLRAAAARRREQALTRATGALLDLARRGESVTFQSVARHAGVSRQWLYQQPELRAEIEQLRGHDDRRSRPIPASQRTSDPSLRQQIQGLRTENQQLRQENADLKTELAISYGTARA